MRRLGLLLALLTSSGCTFEPKSPTRLPDAAPQDAQVDLDAGYLAPDADPRDVGFEDAAPDVGVEDAEPLDAGFEDAEPLDTGPPDMGPTPMCGDGRVEAPEGCDDGNATPGDGCTSCQVDLGYRCVRAPSLCAPSGQIAVVDGADPNCLDEEPDDEPSAQAWCRLSLPLGLDPPPRLLIVQTATYAESILLDDAPPVVFAAPNGATWVSPMGTALTVKGGGRAVVAGFTIVGSGPNSGGVKVENRNSRLTLLDNRIGPADARGVDLRSDAILTMRRNVVRSNQRGGLYLDSNSGYDIANNVVVDNGNDTLDMGGVRIKKTAAGATFVNNSIARNRADGRAAGIRCDVNTEVVNLVVWGNTGDGAAEVTDRCGPRFSLLQAPLAGAGAGNLDLDPQFLDPELRIGPGSPAEDAGDPAGISPNGPAPDEDFDRAPRPTGAAVDMGAYEAR